MTPSHWVLASTAVFIAAFAQGSTGVGFALIVAPVLGLIAPDMLPVCVLVLMLPLNFFVSWHDRDAIDRPSSGWITAGRLAGTLGGLWVLTALSMRQLNLLIGVSAIVAAGVTLLMPAFTPSRSVYVGAGLVTGVTETATGIGGPPLALVYQHHPAAVMRSTIALCFLIGELISLALLWYAGRTQEQQWWAVAELTPALMAGALLSRSSHGRISPRGMRLFVMVFSIASGVLLLVRAA